MKGIKRRDFIKYSGLGIAAIYVGGCGGGGGGGGGAAGGGPVGPASQTIDFTITDAIKEMVTHNPNSPLLPNTAECYYWIYQASVDGVALPLESPGPQIYCKTGDVLTFNVTNALDLPHSFFVPGMVGADTGPIAPGATASVTFTAGAPGTYLYHDNLNAPVNRMMGLHGAFVVMPRAAAAGQALTPYGNPTPAIQQLFNDFGRTAWWPGLRWEEGDTPGALLDFPAPPTRQYIWLCHQASPVLFEEVGLAAQAGTTFNPQTFITAFTADPFVATSNDPRAGNINDVFNRKPQYFTINGQSGHFAHNHPSIVPMHRVGEPTVVRILNAGLMTHSMHLHANHFFVTAINNVPQENPIWIDVFNVYPMDHVDYTIPYMRPPDIPNVRGIGRADQGLLTATGDRTWPPSEEFQVHQPPIGTLRPNPAGTGLPVDIAQPQSPMCYPMHDHSEPTQTSQGGNYNCGLIAGIYFIGDRQGTTGPVINFPIDHEFRMMLEGGGSTSATGPAAGHEIKHVPEV